MRALRLAPLLFVPALLAGCLTSENFSAKLITLQCQRYEECDAAAFSTDFDDQAECRDQLEDFETDCFKDHCEFDAKAAGDCIAAIKGLDCDEFIGGDSPGVCLDIWEECDDVNLAICLAGEGFTFDTF